MYYRNSEILQHKNIHQLLAMSEEEVIALDKEWKEQSAKNRLINEENKRKTNEDIKEFLDLLDKFNIKYKNSTGGKASWLEKNIINPIKARYSYINTNLPTVESTYYKPIEIDGYKLYISFSPAYILEVYKTLKSQFEKAKEYNLQQEKIKNIYIAKAVELGLSIDRSSQEIMDEIDSKLKIEYLAHYHENDPIEIDDNICECELWLYKHHRCSCGNRRIESRVEGNLVNGYFLRVEAY